VREQGDWKEQMSRIGNKIINVVDGVKVNVSGDSVNVEGPKGKLSFPLDSSLAVKIDDGTVSVSQLRRSDGTCNARTDKSGDSEHDHWRQGWLREKA
jgi:ribosomal protein L6P/L9E